MTLELAKSSYRLWAKNRASEDGTKTFLSFLEKLKYSIATGDCLFIFLISLKENKNNKPYACSKQFFEIRCARLNDSPVGHVLLRVAHGVVKENE